MVLVSDLDIFFSLYVVGVWGLLSVVLTVLKSQFILAFISIVYYLLESRVEDALCFLISSTDWLSFFVSFLFCVLNANISPAAIFRIFFGGWT